MAEMREKLMHFFNIGTSEKPKYVLLGDGITSLTEEFNPESETKQYINQANGTTSIKSYTPSISVEKEYIQNDELQQWINEKIKILPTGSSAQSDYIRINILEKTVEGAYPAVKRRCSYQFDSIGGDAGSELTNSMTLGGIGDGIQGTFNMENLTFAET
ncbi:MAG: hypothetical protein J1E83_12645 [Lachnospiraceae bacterium]|nr:hypothetical protein [Lachnospiraceae bacterium]